MELSYPFLVLIFLIALCYSVIGHGGASSYIAAMILFSLPLPEIRTNALVLNIIVSGIAFYSFFKAGHFKISLLWPFILTSIPCAYLGGRISIHYSLFNALVAICLLVFALQLFIRRNSNENDTLISISLQKALPVGAAIGFISGLVGIGGGIFLSPVLLLFKWADAKTAAAVSAAFIFVNSISGLTGQLYYPKPISSYLIVYAVVASVGGFIGSKLGSNSFSAYKLKFALMLVITFASFKLLFSL